MSYISRWSLLVISNFANIQPRSDFKRFCIWDIFLYTLAVEELLYGTTYLLNLLGLNLLLN